MAEGTVKSPIAGAVASPPLSTISTTTLFPQASLIVYGYFTLQLQLLSLTTISLPRVAVTALQLSSYRAAMFASEGNTVRFLSAKQAFWAVKVGRLVFGFCVGTTLSSILYVYVHVAIFPAQSLYVYVYVLVPLQFSLPVTHTSATVGDP